MRFFCKFHNIIGIDFGCETSFTFSNGEKIDFQIQESDRLKRFQRKLTKQQKGSKNWIKTKSKLRKEYQKQTNRKNDLTNKIVAKITKHKTIVIQDEQLSNWQKSNHGKKIQHSILGKVKSKLKTKENVVVLNKHVPTTKVCVECGCYHDDLKLSDRIFKCDCGVEMDRDVHAARNMVWFYKHNVGVGRTEVKRVEMRDKILNVIKHSIESASMKHEDSSL